MLVLALLACGDPSRIRHAPVSAGDTAQNDADTDADADSDSDADTDTDTDADSAPGDTASYGGPTELQGVDVSHWDDPVDWTQLAGANVRFAYVKATEGTTYLSPTFASQFDGAAGVGMIRGAYHFALPDHSDGATQADFFVDNGGAWTADHQTLPGALDIEWNPYSSDSCYGLSPDEMVTWIGDFSDEYTYRTGRPPAIYSSYNYWMACIVAPDFAANPLWCADSRDSVAKIPPGWSTFTFWQYSGTGSLPGISGDVDLSVFEGTWHDLRAFADDR